jgi:hypothetical protein
VVIHDLDVLGAAVAPFEADSPSLIDANQMLPLAVALQRFKSNARRRPQVIQVARVMQQQQLAPRRPFDASARGMLNTSR